MMSLLRLSRRTFGIALLAASTSVCLADGPNPAENSVDAPNGQTISVKMVSPVLQTTDLQIFCVLKHDPAGDKYIEAMADIDAKLGHLLKNLRDRGEFTGDVGETFLFSPPSDSITPKQVLLVGVGRETELTLETLKRVGRIAAREAVRLRAGHVSFAPTLRDQGSTRIDVGDGDAAFVEAWVFAYATERRLQEQKLSPPAEVAGLTIEAGPKYFEAASGKIAVAVQVAGLNLKNADVKPYSEGK